MKKLLLFLAAPLLFAQATFTLNCVGTCPASVTAGSVVNLSLNYTPPPGVAGMAAVGLRLGMPVDVASFTVTPGAASVAAGKQLSQSGVAVVLQGSNPPSNNPFLDQGGVILTIAATMKPALTQTSQVFSVQQPSAATVTASNIPVVLMPTGGLSIPSAVIVPPPPPPPPPTGSKCDKNKDGAVTVADLTLIDQWVLAALQPGGVATIGCDSDANGTCDILDATIVLLSVMDPAHACLAK